MIIITILNNYYNDGLTKGHSQRRGSFQNIFAISRATTIVFLNIYTKDFIDRGSLYRGSTVNVRFKNFTANPVPFHNHLLIKAVTIKNFTLANNNVQ